MPNNRDNFLKPVVDALAKRAAFICSNPDCRAMTIAPAESNDEDFLYVGKAAHICAAAAGGPRYDAAMSHEERSAVSNGIFLCATCADMIDKNGGSDFSVQLLRTWKNTHDEWVRANLNKNLATVPSSTVYNVSSVNQRGGITAGQVHIGPQKRTLDTNIKAQILTMVPDKTRVITVNATMNDTEAYQFADQIKNFLLSKGYRVEGVNQVVNFPPMGPQNFDPTAYTFGIGANL